MIFNLIKRKMGKEIEIEQNQASTTLPIIHHKGIITHPKHNEKGITLYIGDTKLRPVVMPLDSSEDELLEGDVMITDGRNKIHLKFNNDNIEIKTKKLIINGDVTFKGEMTHDGKIVDSRHIHGYIDNDQGVPTPRETCSVSEKCTVPSK